MLSAIYRRCGHWMFKLAVGGACALSVASFGNIYDRNDVSIILEPQLSSIEYEAMMDDDIQHDPTTQTEAFLSTYNKTKSLLRKEIPYYHSTNDEFLSIIVSKPNIVHFCDYSTNREDYRIFAASNVVITSVYQRIDGKELQTDVLERFGIDTDVTPLSMQFSSNGVVVGNADWKESNIIGTALHNVAKFIDERGKLCDSDGIIIETNEKTTCDFVYELKLCHTNGDIIQVLSTDTPNDIACVEWQGNRVSKDFMQVGDFVENPGNAVLAGLFFF